MGAIMAIAQKHDLKIIEGCAHAIEAEWKGRKTGTFGDYGCFSFCVTKNVATGEGGMVAAKHGRNTVSLPLSAKLSDGDVMRIVEAVQGVLA